MIEKSNSLSVAQEILSLVQHRIDGKIAQRLTVDAFSNGREQGFHISGGIMRTKHMMAVSFGQFRANDDIVVYHGRKAKFSPQGNYYTGIQREPKFFKAGNHEAAAEYILDFFGQGR